MSGEIVKGQGYLEFSKKWEKPLTDFFGFLPMVPIYHWLRGGEQFSELPAELAALIKNSVRCVQMVICMFPKVS